LDLEHQAFGEAVGRCIDLDAEDAPEAGNVAEDDPAIDRERQRSFTAAQQMRRSRGRARSFVNQEIYEEDDEQISYLKLKRHIQ